MLIYCILLYSLLYGNAASVVPSTNPSSILIRDTSVADVCPRKRLEIIWSCIATILASSWVAVHPNLPHRDDSKLKKILRRVELMLWAIITPELIIYWAARQWYGARWMEKYLRGEADMSEEVGNLPEMNRPANDRDLPWTRTHGFFLQMGGFMIHKKGQEKRVLTLPVLARYYSQGRIDLSGITEARINDHSKADSFAKGIALLQTLWFIVQCVARFADRHLVLTELELVTAALAVLSLVMYALWWNKPFNAEIPIVLTVSDIPHSFKNDGSEDQDTIDKPFLIELKDALYQFKHILSRVKEFLTDNGTSTWTNDVDSDDAANEITTGVPTFFSIPTSSELDDLKLRLPCFSIAALFGAIHCAGWSTKIHFSSHVASLLWRVASGIITASPVIWSLYFAFVSGASMPVVYKISRSLEDPFKYLSVFTIPLYISSRIILLVLAFVELRNVPPGALDTIKWANVLPFIH